MCSTHYLKSKTHVSATRVQACEIGIGGGGGGHVWRAACSCSCRDVAAAADPRKRGEGEVGRPTVFVTTPVTDIMEREVAESARHP